MVPLKIAASPLGFSQSRASMFILYWNFLSEICLGNRFCELRNEAKQSHQVSSESLNIAASPLDSSQSRTSKFVGC